MTLLITTSYPKNKWPILLFVFFQLFFFHLQAQVPAINKVEYFLDTDPGYGLATNLSFAGTTDAAGIINIDLLPLSSGVHILGVRSRDASGAWSLDNKWLFVKPYSTVASIQPKISLAEWYLDDDPGYGNGIALPIAATQDLAGLSFNIDMVPLGQGVHIVGVRSKDANGAWSPDNKWLFVKPYSSFTATQPTITRVEWYLDNDPGFGNGAALPIAAAQDLSGLSFNIDMVPLGQGVHIVGVRSKDANSGWSLDNKWLFVKPYSSSAVTQPNINRVEWYLDTDPGYGKATPIAISPSQNLTGLAFNISLTNLYQGVHTVGIRSLDANGAWSLDNKWIFLNPYTAGASVPNIAKMEYYVDVDPGYGKASSISITPGTDIAMQIFDADISSVAYGTHKIGIRSMDANGAWSLDNEVDFTGGTGTTWIGVTSTSWTTASNWSKGIVPTAADPITIPAGTPFSPIIPNSVTANCKSIKINPGAIVTVATGGNLKVGQ
jgi:hypothetical protein